MLTFYDTMLKRRSPVEPIEAGVVKMYTCGPTVYRDVHIGNLRSYLMADWIRRALEAHGLSVKQVKNITDVGHMRQEMLEQGEDKVIAAAIAAGMSPAEIAQMYTDRFHADERKLNITPAEYYPKATDHIDEMIAIVRRLVEHGYAYEVQGNVYFSISRFRRYGALSGNTQDESLLEAVRVEADPLKRDPRDFTLWKLAEPGRELKWPSPWGHGFPGWHIECSAMSIKYLGEQFDIHTGGVDNIFPHHEGEIAQSEGFTGGRVVNLWVHGQHLLADGVKMAKSAGNSFIMADIEARGIDPLAFRYLCLTTRFNSRLNFTFTSLKAAQRALLRLKHRVWEWEALPKPRPGDEQVRQEWEGRFMARVDDNLDMPGALALTWELVRSELPGQVKLGVLHSYDRILGLDLDNVSESYRVSSAVLSTVERRAAQREHRRYQEADALRDELERDGYSPEDTPTGTRVRPKSRWEKHEEVWPTISSSAEVASLVDQPDSGDFSILIVASSYLDDVRRCVDSALRWAGQRSVEVVALDNGSTDGTGEWLEQAASTDPRLRTIHADHALGEGAAKNIVLKQSRGRTVMMLDTSVEVQGDIFGPVDDLLAKEAVGVAGPFGLRTSDLHHFHGGEGEAGDMDAMQAYCFAFRRSRLADVGLMRESFRFYRNLDLDYSFHFKDRGYRIVADPALPIKRHEHRVWSALGEAERDELSRKNYRRFLDKWGHRSDLLVAGRTQH
jgi:cysteinyl-tRNA synthetase